MHACTVLPVLNLTYTCISFPKHACVIYISVLYLERVLYRVGLTMVMQVVPCTARGHRQETGGCNCKGWTRRSVGQEHPGTDAGMWPGVQTYVSM